MVTEENRREPELVLTLKSQRELDLMRQASAVVVEAHQMMHRMVRPGITTGELDVAVEELFRQRGVQPLFKGFPGEVPFPAVTCLSVNEQIVHGIPGDRVLAEGDLLSVDTACRLEGWCGDAAWTYPVGEIDRPSQKLMDAGRKTLDLALRECGRKKTWRQVALAMQRFVEKRGYSVVREFVGHGIGREMHEPPQVPNYISDDLAGEDFPLRPGLTLAIEPMVNAGQAGSKVLRDHWTAVTRDGRRSVHFEHTIAITKEGVDVLTKGVGEAVN